MLGASMHLCNRTTCAHAVVHRSLAPRIRISSPTGHSNWFKMCSQYKRVMSSQSSSPRVSVTYSNEKKIAHVALSRPEKLNSLDLPMFESIAATAKELRSDSGLRAIIISGEGRAFCSGLDVKGVISSGSPLKTVNRLLERPSGYERKEEDDEIPVAYGNLAQDVGYLWRDLSVPVIAVLHGMCFGGGMQIALGADMRYATPDCKLSIMEAKWGLIPDMAASVTLRELVRIDVAKELTMTGRIISGTEAAQLGLVTRCVEDPMAEAKKIANEIASRSPDSVAASKKLFQETWVAEEQRCLDLETSLQRKLLYSWNQAAASGRNFGVNAPYIKKKDLDD